MHSYIYLCTDNKFHIHLHKKNCICIFMETGDSVFLTVSPAVTVTHLPIMTPVPLCYIQLMSLGLSSLIIDWSACLTTQVLVDEAQPLFPFTTMSRSVHVYMCAACAHCNIAWVPSILGGVSVMSSGHGGYSDLIFVFIIIMQSVSEIKRITLHMNT